MLVLPSLRLSDGVDACVIGLGLVGVPPGAGCLRRLSGFLGDWPVAGAVPAALTNETELDANDKPVELVGVVGTTSTVLTSTVVEASGVTVVGCFWARMKEASSSAGVAAASVCLPLVPDGDVFTLVVELALLRSAIDSCLLFWRVVTKRDGVVEGGGRKEGC